MKYIVIFEDDPANAHKRSEFMADHLRFLETHQEQIHAAGPVKDTSDNQPAGGIWAVTAENAESVMHLVRNDPFWPTGLRKSVRILEWNLVFSTGIL